LQGLSQVRVVGADNQVEVKTVTLGQQSGDRWIVAKGLEPGARVIVDAPLIRPGTVVTPAVLAATRMSASGAGPR
jgi:membrane fusion protein, multidrug efflux system